MFKKLDILIIRSFIGPFIVTFFVALFVLVMQFFWLYMDELIGKGLSSWMIMQLLLLMSATLVPLALPLSVLLASLMTFGNMGENFELVAIKSSGISLLRFMQPLGIFITIVCGLAFVFNNNVIPVANLKALSLLYDVRNAKPTLNIKPERFNSDIPGFAIKVGSKDEDGFTIHDIIIYDHTDLVGNNKVIIAKEGKMMPTSDKQALIFKLKDGWLYDEGVERNGRTPEYPQTRTHFATWDKVFDLSAFNFTRANQDLFKTAYQMMDVKQLSDGIDSFAKMMKNTPVTAATYMSPYVSLTNGTKEASALEAGVDTGHYVARTYTGSYLNLIPEDKKVIMLQATCNNLRNLKSLMNNNALQDKLTKDNFLKYSIEYHRKFSLSFACLLLFLIGAPLGAIIRKGGLGLPMIVAVAFFIAFLMLNKIGENLAKTSSYPSWIGMWLCTIVLLPIAIWLIAKARNDSQIFSKEMYLRGWRVIKGLLTPKKEAIA